MNDYVFIAVYFDLGHIRQQMSRAYTDVAYSTMFMDWCSRNTVVDVLIHYASYS